ncbi:MAG: RpoL/Rpb11 RNA polymerase subunit family protein [Candidatus Diapherotrites archaeon]
MEINILKNSKDEMEFQIDSLTLVEILRVYLNKDPAVTFVAWRREHITKNPIMLVKTKGKSSKKALSDSILAITKDLDEVEADFKKLK